MSRSRVASRPARSSAASSLSLAVAILSRRRVPAYVSLLACMAAPVGSHSRKYSPMALRPSPAAVGASGAVALPPPEIVLAVREAGAGCRRMCVCTESGIKTQVQ